MDGNAFDRLTIAFDRLRHPASRRGALRLLLGGAATGLAAPVAARGADATNCRGYGERCKKHSQCCFGTCKYGVCLNTGGGGGGGRCGVCLPGWQCCRNSDVCVPPGINTCCGGSGFPWVGNCCNGGGFCGVGSRCCGTGTGCCGAGETCCRNRGCCPAGYQCHSFYGCVPHGFPWQDRAPEAVARVAKPRLERIDLSAGAISLGSLTEGNAGD